MTARSEKFWTTFRWAAPLYIGVFIGFVLWYLVGLDPLLSGAIAVMIAIADFYLLKWLLPRLLDR